MKVETQEGQKGAEAASVRAAQRRFGGSGVDSVSRYGRKPAADVAPASLGGDRRGIWVPPPL